MNRPLFHRPLFHRPLFHRLSPQDAGYLRRETPSQPMHFTMCFDVESTAGEPMSMDELRRHLGARVAAAPWLRRRLKRAPGGLGPTLWVDDPRFSIDRHVLPAPAELARAGASPALDAVTTMRLPLDRPLWRLFVLPPADHGTTTMLLSVHHALSDGGLMQETLDVLFGPDDREPEHAAAGRVRRLAGTTAGVTLYAATVRLSERSRRVNKQVRSDAGDQQPDRLGLYGTVGPRRSTAGATISLASLRSIRTATGATINDLFLTAATAALHDAVARRGLAVSELLALVPRNVRSDQDAAAAGNRTSSMLISLPISVSAVGERLGRVQQATTAAKAAAGSAGNAAFRFDVALSNVAYGGGHRIGGRRIQLRYSSAPLQGDNRVLACATSHNDDFVITYTADGDHFPDVTALAERTLEELWRLDREVVPASPVV
jgi:diacylglycerol O-acyltransferase / wax synthase